MKILFAEDNQDFAASVKHEIEKIVGPGNVTLAMSKESATQAISDNFYDLFILDLCLPLTDDGLDADVAHGEAVFGFCKANACGTPVCFLTASSTERFVIGLLNKYSLRKDYWGSNEEFPGLMVFKKIDLSELLGFVAECQDKYRNLGNIELRGAGNLAPEEQRILKMFTQRAGGQICKFIALKGGLSDVRVFSLEILSGYEARLNLAVARIGNREKISEESRKYDSMVGALGIGSFPSKLCLLEYGAKNSSAIFYRLANNHDQSLFDLAQTEPKSCFPVIEKLRETLQPWAEGSTVIRRRISEIRQCLLKDVNKDAIKSKFSLGWIDEIEDLTVSVRWGRTHGDLHGGNILVSRELSPVLIDFGDVSEGALPLDVSTLLLSHFFHPETADELIASIGINEIIAAVNKLEFPTEWSLGEAMNFIIQWLKDHSSDSERTIFASIYSYTLRQLKFDDTNKELALGILEVCRTRLASTI
ncbi:TPA: phosphotransferase [Pseudomonas aeruginosa]